MEKVKGEHKAWAVVAYFFFFIPLLLTDVRKEPFVRYHIRQGLGLFIAFFALRFLTLVVLVPLFAIMGFLSLIVVPMVNLALLVLLVMGVMNAVQGEQKPIPLIGGWADKYLRI